jgi:hypothetical protein
MNEAIRNIFVFLERLGLVDVLLPFVLIFAVTFGIFEKVKVFGEGKRNVHILVSFAMSFMVVSVLAYVNLIATITYYFVFGLIMVISFLMVYALFGGEFKFSKMFKGGKSGGGSGGSGGSGSGGNSSDQSGPHKGLKELEEWDPSKGNYKRK